MGFGNEALYHHFGGTDSEDYGGGYYDGPRREKSASEQIPKTCRTCGIRGLHWRSTRQGRRLHELVGPLKTLVIPHHCDPELRAKEIASGEQYLIDGDYRAACARMGRPL